MSLKKKLLSIAGVLLVVGALLLAFGDTRGAEPELECAERGQPTSGYQTSACPNGTTAESQEKWGDWYSMPRYGRIAGLGLVVLGLASGVASLVVRNKKNVQ